MNRWITVVVSLITLILLTSVDRKEAGAYSILLDDATFNTEIINDPLSLSPGNYRFDISYWIAATITPPPDNTPVYYDLFSYAYLSGPTSSQITREVLLNFVDIDGSIPQDNPKSEFRFFTVESSEPFIFPAFVLTDNVPLNTATVHVEYDIVQVGAPVPEPSTFLLFGGGLLGIYGFVRRRI